MRGFQKWNFISDAEVSLSQPEYQYLPVQKAELEALIRIAKRSLRERKMLDDTKPPLGSRIRSMILVYDAFGETYTDADKFALKIMANLLKEVVGDDTV